MSVDKLRQQSSAEGRGNPSLPQRHTSKESPAIQDFHPYNHLSQGGEGTAHRTVHRVESEAAIQVWIVKPDTLTRTRHKIGSRGIQKLPVLTMYRL